jgi:hypothetical protein
MKGQFIKILLVWALLTLFSLGDVKSQSAEFSENNLVFLCIGQSNMEGNAQPESVDKTGVDGTRFKKMYCANSDGSKKGTWATAYPPLCRQGCGLTPVDYFGRYLCDNLASKYNIYVIVVAVAGCSLKLFDKDKYSSYLSDSGTADWLRNIANDYGGNPYGRLIEMAKKAQEIGVIKGILLHQGETDAYNDEWVDRAEKVYKDILKDLGLKTSNTPLLVGEVVNADQNGACSGANTTIAKLANKLPSAFLISSKGCSAGPDRLHFSAEGYRMLGTRYGEKMKSYLKIKGYELNAVDPIMEDHADAAIYNMNGQQLYTPTRGINIINGHKYYLQP